ncbi:hypothetical protein H8S90_01975 [Olivibacter sp. SDN3]|uniref:hypothetical protein n=1 Tax=Olivibacter sp. SDN3 TaxID=2764720 RepID=UPI0016519BC2|nr:hypothetical protein [Olivibacter sp. SDN3]QNL50414.1 hypothetical protein H8S90_01975 [Olivibacter sp. SDN3]
MRKCFVGIGLMSLCATNVFAQKIDKKFKQFYRDFQENVTIKNIDALKEMMHYPLQTIYWIDELNHFTDEEKADGLINAEQFEKYSDVIFHQDVQRLVPTMEVERIQQIDVEASGDYYKRLGKLIDDKSSLLELYCQFSEGSSVGDDYFAFIFGKINDEYKVIAYYGKERIKE